MRKRYVVAATVAAVAVATACSDSPTELAKQRTRAPSAPSATNVAGAAFTSVNETVDGTGHCANGNPNNNCNIYDGKQYVWLDGGPAAAFLGGDGDYFFAVLSPSGQANPNDAATVPDGGSGSPTNLSDDFDAYTNRTFSVSGNSVSYSGTHDFDSGKIRLMPYSNTLNPGGVYILAVCSLADGYPVASSKCKYDAFKVHVEGGGTEAAAPTILKDANGAYDNTYGWTIQKAVDKTLVKQVGGSATFNYTVTVTHDGGTVSNVAVSGTIQVFNPNASAITGADVTDQLSDGTTCTVTGGANVTLASGANNFAYSCSLSALPSGSLDNTATVTWPAQTLTEGALAAGSDNFMVAGITFTANVIDETISVTDTYAGTLGTVSVGDANPSTFTYSRTIAIPASSCVSYGNTATFTTNDTGTTGSASQTVTVCGPARTGALTIGFWKGPNGNSLIQNYCMGSPSLATYLSSLGSGSGPFANAAGKTCSQLVTYVNGIINGASATNMNTMLKAQMLATALDVYFSSAGYSTTAYGSGKNQVKPPSSFLPNGGIGTFTMDLTAICPMVDNTTTGTATCQGGTPSTNGFASGALPSAAMTINSSLNVAATTPSPFNGSTSNSIWYAGDRTKEEILKNVFDQINNQDAFAP